MNRLLLLLLALASTLVPRAQLLTWSPGFPVENDPAQNFTITVDATKGNKGLLNYAGDVYVHLGVITSLSSGASDWKYVKTTWGTTSAAARATYAGNNKWQFTISGSLRAYFGITNAAETIQKIAIIFRNSSGNLKQVNTDGGDMFIPVYKSNTLAVRIDQPGREPKYNAVPEAQTWVVGSAFTVQAAASQSSTLKLYHNGTLLQSEAAAQSITAAATVSAEGMQQIVAEASDETSARYDTINVFVAPAASPVAALPAGMRDGVNYESDNTVTLVLTAPGKNLVTVIGDFTNWTESKDYIMNKTPDGKKFWLRITGLSRGVEYGYQYKVDNSLVIADPYAQKVLDPGNDPYITSTTYPNLKAYPTGKTSGVVSVLQTAEAAYNWGVNNFARPDKRSLVIYELLVRDFVKAHDWKTLKDTLGYLKRLGINAIEIMPFNEFEGNNSWGYNPDFYFAPDKYYGPKNTLKEFIDSCHSNGIAVIMDIALNHSFGLSPMVQLYWDAANNRPAANSPWFNAVATHPYNVGYDLNHESADTKTFVGRVVEHWLLNYKIDGFRFDLSKGFTQKVSGENVSQWSQYDAGRITTWKGYYDTVQSKSQDAYVILEHFADNTEEKELAEYGMLLWGNENYHYNEASMGWVATSDFSTGLHTARSWSKPHLVTYMESHDEERLMYKNLNYGAVSGGYNIKDTATALKRIEQNAAFFLTQPGPKMIWQFGELGYDYPINYCENGTINNDCRLSPKPICWDYLSDARRKHVYDVFSSLLRLRFHPWYREAFMSSRVEQSFTNAFKWLKVTTDTSNVVVVGNFGTGSITGMVTFQSAGVWYDYLDSTTITATGAAQSLTLQPGEFHVYVNRNVHNLTTTPVAGVPWSEGALNVRLYPNPVGSRFVVEVQVPESGLVRLDVINSAGQYAGTLQQSFLVKGEHQFSLNRNALQSAGTYYLRITTKSATKTIPFTIQ